MNLLLWTTLVTGESKMVRAADRLAAACQEQVWRVVQLKALTMSAAESRGYVRARAGLIVKHAVAAELARSPHFVATQDRLIDMTVEQVVRLIGAELRAVRPTLRAGRRAA